jgi:hypothetical protein
VFATLPMLSMQNTGAEHDHDPLESVITITWNAQPPDNQAAIAPIRNIRSGGVRPRYA